MDQFDPHQQFSELQSSRRFFMQNTLDSIYFEAAWVLSLFGATALIRESLGELCMNELARYLFHQSFVAGKDLDSLLSCSNGGRSLGFASAWRLRNFYRGNRRLQLVCCTPLLCWVVGLPFKLVAVSAFRDSSRDSQYLGKSFPLIVGIFWIAISIVLKIIAILSSHRQDDCRSIFQERFARFDSLFHIFESCPPVVAEVDPHNKGIGVLGLSISFDSNGLKLQPSIQYNV